MRRLAGIALLLLFLAACSGFSPRDAVFPSASIPLVTFVFDDGYDTDYLVARDIFSDQGAVACSAITTDWINRPGYMSTDQIIGLRDAGWEIMGHTATHPNLRSLAPAQVEDELSRSKAALEGLGVPVKNLVYPYNKSNETVREIARKYYRSGRGGKNKFNTAFIDPYDLRSFANKPDLVTMKGHIDRAYSEKNWLIIYQHEIDAKITMTNKKGIFMKGERILFSPSGALGRLVRDSWFLSAGSLHFAPLFGTPRPGDTIIGQRSSATAQLSHVVFNEREALGELVRYIRTQYPGMKIVTIDQGLDLLGMPSMNR
jgi:peptidoglycan/xylan/chitin deacetylase (PgdA/CDA1 family)